MALTTDQLNTLCYTVSITRTGHEPSPPFGGGIVLPQPVYSNDYCWYWQSDEDQIVLHPTNWTLDQYWVRLFRELPDPASIISRKDGSYICQASMDLASPILGRPSTHLGEAVISCWLQWKGIQL